MTAKKQLIIGLSLFFFTLIIAHAQTMPTLPAVLQGNVSINGNPAPAGTEITVIVDGVEKGSANTTKEGLYIVPVSGKAGDEGKQISLLVNGIDTKINTTWSSGKVETIDLAVEKQDNNIYIYALVAALACLAAFFALRRRK